MNQLHSTTLCRSILLLTRSTWLQVHRPIKHHLLDKILSREGTGDGPLELSGASRPGLGARDGVAGDVTTVDVVLDALVGGGVEGGAGNAVGAAAAGVGGARASDLDVDALGVVLGAVLLAGGVQGDDLVAEHVVTGGEGLGDGEGPGVVVACEAVNFCGSRRAG